jgi:hypothetical protein
MDYRNLDITLAADDTIFGHPVIDMLTIGRRTLSSFILSIGIKRMMEIMPRSAIWG